MMEPIKKDNETVVGNTVNKSVVNVKEINIESRDLTYPIVNTTEPAVGVLNNNGSEDGNTFLTKIKTEYISDEGEHSMVGNIKIEVEKMDMLPDPIEVKVEPNWYGTKEVTSMLNPGSTSIFIPGQMSKQISEYGVNCGDPLLTIDADNKELLGSHIKMEKDLNQESSHTSREEEQISHDVDHLQYLENETKSHNIVWDKNYLDLNINEKNKPKRISPNNKLQMKEHYGQIKNITNVTKDIKGDITRLVDIQVKVCNSEEFEENYDAMSSTMKFRNLFKNELSNDKTSIRNLKFCKSNNCFTCKICKDNFKSKFQLQKHIKSHTDEQQYQCTFCTKIFNRKDNLNAHIKTHTGAKQFPCSICHKPFSRKHNLSVHMMTHTGEKPFKCTICPKKYRSKNNLMLHMTSHTGLKLFPCELCPKKFARKYNLSIHMKIHNGEKFSCDICQKLFADQRYLLKHIKNHANEELFACDICKRVFSRKRYLITHINSHLENKLHLDIKDEVQEELPNSHESNTQVTPHTEVTFIPKVSGIKTLFTCDICHKSFSLKSSLGKHLQIHTGETFTCDICQKTFITKWRLNSHLKGHTGEKSFTCYICQKAFLLKSILNKHLKSHMGNKTFRCHFCQKAFLQKCHLNDHIKIHTGEKPFACEVCQKSFSRKSKLNAHKISHSGVKKFTCEICEKSFKRKDNFLLHKMSHTGEKPLECSFCHKKYLCQNKLALHVKIHTGEEPFSCDICQKKFLVENHLNRHAKIHW